MKQSLFIRNQILIRAGREKLWQILTNPEQTKKYMFGCETISSWRPGGPLLWKGLWEGKEHVFVKGSVVQYAAPELLEYTTFDPHSSIEDIPSNYLHVVYKLTEQKGETLLTVSQGDYSKVEEGEKRYQEASNGGAGWDHILQEIKKLAEAGQ